MNRFLLILLTLLLISPALFAGEKNEKATNNATEINWMTLDEVQVAMKKQPRKVYVDVYTGWCGWCKVMDKKTFRNAEVIKYMNQNFYAVKLDAERKDSLRFMGKMFGFSPEHNANSIAVELLRGQMSYPTSVIMEENFLNPQPVPGYLDVQTIERVLKYLGENIYKTKNFEDFNKNFTPTWQPAQG